MLLRHYFINTCTSLCTTDATFMFFTTDVVCHEWYTFIIYEINMYHVWYITSQNLKYEKCTSCITGDYLKYYTILAMILLLACVLTTRLMSRKQILHITIYVLEECLGEKANELNVLNKVFTKKFIKT